MQELMVKVMSGDFATVFEKSPPGLLEARKAIMKLIEDLKSELKLSNDKFILGGFSQGKN